MDTITPLMCSLKNKTTDQLIAMSNKWDETTSNAPKTYGNNSNTITDQLEPIPEMNNIEE